MSNKANDIVSGPEQHVSARPTSDQGFCLIRRGNVRIHGGIASDNPWRTNVSAAVGSPSAGRIRSPVAASESSFARNLVFGNPNVGQSIVPVPQSFDMTNPMCLPVPLIRDDHCHHRDRCADEQFSLVVSGTDPMSIRIPKPSGNSESVDLDEFGNVLDDLR